MRAPEFAGMQHEAKPGRHSCFTFQVSALEISVLTNLQVSALEISVLVPVLTNLLAHHSESAQ